MKSSNEPTISWINGDRGLIKLHRRPIGYVRKTLDGKWNAQLLWDFRTPSLAAQALVDTMAESESVA